MTYKLVIHGPIEDVEEARVLEWHGDPGRAFAPGQLIVEVETHKAVIEVRAAQPGILRRVLCPPGGWRAVGEPLAVLTDEADEPVPEALEDLKDLRVDFALT
jgi:pyruvate/2-oxoglutarate dehydrogenase complex dihydrolipoamide acyltransferase (E2) component